MPELTYEHVFTSLLEDVILTCSAGAVWSQIARRSKPKQACPGTLDINISDEWVIGEELLQTIVREISKRPLFL